MNRYSRHIILSEVGQEGQNKLLKAKVLVIGAGGLGCPALQYLAAAGIGTLGIMDFDTVEKSNLQRQILFGSSSLGKNKAIEAKRRLTDLNSSISIQAYPERLTSSNAATFFSNYDIIVDGSDNFETRYLINDAAILANKPVVYGAIYKFEGQVSVFNYNNGPSYRCLFPTEPRSGSVANCSEVGVIGVLPGIIGSMQANEVLKIILEIGDVLSGNLLCYDSKSNRTSLIKIKRSEVEFSKVRSRQLKSNDRTHIQTCEVSNQITLDEVFKLDPIVYVDVREHHELPKLEISNCIKMPLIDIEQHLDQFKFENNYIFFCQTGVRSDLALSKLPSNLKANCYSLKDSASSLVDYLKIKTP